ncbi:MAG: hypothetical protein GY869_13660, partial [Planctomycetes bacterium]|nr:hypothetical protein [Planctomycetota bacterium]
IMFAGAGCSLLHKDVKEESHVLGTGAGEAADVADQEVIVPDVGEGDWAAILYQTFGKLTQLIKSNAEELQGFDETYFDNSSKAASKSLDNMGSTTHESITVNGSGSGIKLPTVPMAGSVSAKTSKGAQASTLIARSYDEWNGVIVIKPVFGWPFEITGENHHFYGWSGVVWTPLAKPTETYSYLQIGGLFDTDTSTTNDLHTVTITYNGQTSSVWDSDAGYVTELVPTPPTLIDGYYQSPSFYEPSVFGPITNTNSGLFNLPVKVDLSVLPTGRELKTRDFRFTKGGTVVPYNMSVHPYKKWLPVDGN